MAMRYYAPFPGGGGEPARPRGPHALRIGDAERDAAAADLGEHYAAGRLSLDELHERLDAVLAAKTFGQLTRIMADLPGPGRLPWRTGPVLWQPGLPYEWPPGMPGGMWLAAPPPMARYGPREPQGPPMDTDRAGRFAALSLLLLAMLLWLFTALLFARHGLYQNYGPVGPPGGP
ncbi:MAG TPA: DUF1707 domain-containing protein [Trebonia sp.]|nr:DUF1707 domain-containing protein [Trebonia sp.]